MQIHFKTQTSCNEEYLVAGIEQGINISSFVPGEMRSMDAYVHLSLDSLEGKPNNEIKSIC